MLSQNKTIVYARKTKTNITTNCSMVQFGQRYVFEEDIEVQRVKNKETYMSPMKMRFWETLSCVLQVEVNKNYKC